MRNLTFILSDKLQKYWLCHHIFMAISPLMSIGDRFAHPGSRNSVFLVALFVMFNIPESLGKSLFIRL
jgi:hypothetical protein